MTTMRAHECSVLAIDMQTRLLPAIAARDAVLAAACRLMRVARWLDVPVVGTEHWAEKIGPTDPDVLDLLDHTIQKTHFDATRESGFQAALPRRRHKILLLGVESHICVLQTGLGLARLGYQPILVDDAVGSRRLEDKIAACARWSHHGLEAITSEMAMFEWLETPAHPKFREVLQQIKDV